MLREPSFVESEFEQLRNQQVTGIMAQLSEPVARASNELARHFNAYPKGDWRYTPTIEETLEEVRAVKLEDAKRFHANFYGADVAEIAIVGDFDEDRALALIKELFDGWKPKVPYVRIPIDYKDIPAANKVISTPDKENAVYLARENINMNDEDPDYPALYVANYILGGGASFDSRLGERIRQKEGLSYGVGSDLVVGPIDKGSAFSVFAIAAPANVAKVEAAVKEEIARALKDGFTDKEVANAKTGLITTRLQNRAQDAGLAAAWVANLHINRTFQYSKEFEAKINALTAAQIVAAFRKHVDPAKISVVKAGDFTKK